MTQNTATCSSWKRRRTASAWTCLFFAVSGLSLIAQVALDGKFGSSGFLTGPNYTISPQMGATRGNNLFHSFTQFDLKAGDVATFTGPANIQNILSRVTGGSPSAIDGKIRSQISGANLFLINPAGVIFGPHATLDVSGSFAASSANYLALADGARFVASLNADDSTLSSAPVNAFGFLGENHGAIEIQKSAFKVSQGKTVTIAGGDISMDGGTVTTPGGSINALSIKSAGEVPVDLASQVGTDLTAAFPKQGQIALRNGAQLDASGQAGGRIVIRGGSLRLENSRIQANTTGAGEGKGIDVGIMGAVDLINGGQITSVSPNGLGSGGNINVTAGSIRLDGEGSVDDFFSPKTQISAATGDVFMGGGKGKGGDIVIKTGRLDLVNSAEISSTTYGAGDAGRVEINASSVSLDALLVTPTQISANTQQNQGGGKAGDIAIHTDTLEVRNGATIVTTSFGSGNAGVIDISARTVNLLSAGIVTAGTFGAGKGGNVQITTDSMHIDGTDFLMGGPDFLTGIQAVTTSSSFPAPGGNIQVKANSLELDHNGSLFTTSFGRGTGGNIAVQAQDLTLANNSTIRAAGEAVGPAGKLSLYAQKDVVLSRTSAISTSAPGSSGGDITVSAGSKIRLTDSQITAQAGLDGGNIRVEAPQLIYLLRSTLTGQADTTGSGFGNGGNLTTEPPHFFIVNDGALISKSSFGNGGNITIRSDYFFQSASVIDASAPFGLPGTVVVSAPEVDLSGGLIDLPGGLLDAEAQLRPDCAVRLSENLSSFIVLGRGGLPIQPGGFVPSGMAPPRDETK